MNWEGVKEDKLKVQCMIAAITCSLLNAKTLRNFSSSHLIASAGIYPTPVQRTLPIITVVLKGILTENSIVNIDALP